MPAWFKGDASWANFVAATIEDVHAAMRAPPDPEPCQVRTLEDMSPEEIAELQRRYGAKVKGQVYRLAPSHWK